MDFAYSPKTEALRQRVLRFMDEHIYPAEARYEAEIEANTKAGKRSPSSTPWASSPSAPGRRTSR